MPLASTTRKVNLLLASYVFYAAWNPLLILLLSVVANLGMLLYFKYGTFLLQNFTVLMASFGIDYDAPKFDVVLPVGISFYTFATMSYTLEVYLRRAQPARNFLDYALLVTFFPHLFALQGFAIDPALRWTFFHRLRIHGHGRPVLAHGVAVAACRQMAVAAFRGAILCVLRSRFRVVHGAAPPAVAGAPGPAERDGRPQAVGHRGVPVLLVRDPSDGAYLAFENRKFPRPSTWDLLLKRSGAPGIHFEDYPALNTGYELPGGERW